METIGEYLQNARQSRGLSLEEVASRTRISIRMLKALEANDFSQVPSEVFAKGFIRSYSKCLGLNEEEVRRRYRESTAGFYLSVPKAQPELQTPPSGLYPRRFGSRWVVAGLILGVAGLIFLAVYGRLGLSPVPGQADLMPPSLAPEGSEQAVPAREGPSLPSSVDPSVGVPGLPEAPDSDRGAAQSDLLLVIEATDTSWVVAEIDGAQIKEMIIKPGEVIRWKAREKFVLTLGNAGGVNIQFDGKSLGPLGPPGKVVRDIVLTR